MKGDSLKSQLKDYVNQIENEIDLRYESVVDSLESYRSECKSKFFKFKKFLKSKFQFYNSH